MLVDYPVDEEGYSKFDKKPTPQQQKKRDMEGRKRVREMKKDWFGGFVTGTTLNMEVVKRYAEQQGVNCLVPMVDMDYVTDDGKTVMIFEFRRKREKVFVFVDVYFPGAKDREEARVWVTSRPAPAEMMLDDVKLEEFHTKYHIHPKYEEEKLLKAVKPARSKKNGGL